MQRCGGAHRGGGVGGGVGAVVVAKREVEARRRRALTVCSIHPSNAVTNNRYTHPQFD